MDTIQFTLGGGLAPAQLDRIHLSALTILDEIGVEVSNPALLKALAGQSGVRLQGMRVRLAPDLVDRLVREHRAALSPPEAPGNDFFLEILSGYAFDLIDLDTGRTRPMATADCVALARIVDALHDEGLRGGTPGLPQDVPAAVREVLAYKISLEHTRVPGWPGFTSQAGGDAVLRMAEAAGQPVGLSVFVRDPLMVEGPTVDMAVEFMRRKARLGYGIGNMPMAGVSAPLALPAAFASSVASSLGGFVVFKLFGADIGITPLVFPFDMRHGAIAMGTPEHVQSWLMAEQLCAYYNGGRHQWFCSALQTNAVQPDPHSYLTRVAFATAGALHGARRFGYAGLLGIDKTFSLEQLMADFELLDYLRHLMRPIEFPAGAPGLDAVRAAGPGGEFLSHPETLAACHEPWSSAVFPDRSPEQAAGQPPDAVRDALRARARQVEPRGHVLAASVVRELDAIYRDFAEAVR